MPTSTNNSKLLNMHTVEDLIKAGKNEVRNNSDLMSSYIKLFEEKFGRKPDCAGCTFNSDWNRLTQNQILTSTNNTIMSDKTFLLRDNSIIYSYDLEVQENQFRRIRRYGNLMNEEFAENYLTHGTPEQIEERKRQFKILPEKFRTMSEIDATDYEKLAELKKQAEKKGYPEEEYININNDSDMSAYIEAKNIESEAEAKRLREEAEERMRIQREEKEAEEKTIALKKAEDLTKQKDESEAAKAKNEKKK